MLFDSFTYAAIDLYHSMISPFIDNFFMRKALVAAIAIVFGAVPVGIIVVLRRMSLVGDAMSHAILPGAAVAFIISGMSMLALTVGGLIAGIAVAFFATYVSRTTGQKEDISFASFYLIALSLGVTLVSTKGSNIDLMHMLFGTILSVDNESLFLVSAITTITLVILALIYRPLVIECLDPNFMKAMKVKTSGLYHHVFVILMVLNLVSGFRALGTLMAVGLMMLPVAAARLWAETIGKMLLIGISSGLLASYSGLLISYHFDIPSGPAIILVAGVIYLLSMLFGLNGGFFSRIYEKKHLKG